MMAVNCDKIVTTTEIVTMSSKSVLLPLVDEHGCSLHPQNFRFKHPFLQKKNAFRLLNFLMHCLVACINELEMTAAKRTIVRPVVPLINVNSWNATTFVISMAILQCWLEYLLPTKTDLVAIK